VTGQTRTRTVTLVAKAQIEIEPGVILPAGSYNSMQKQIRLATLSGMSWTKPEYMVELSADQLVYMVAKNMENCISIEYDLTKFVRLGQIVIS
jgi:hypothetical protein